MAHAGEEFFLVALVAWMVYLAVQGRKRRTEARAEAGPCLYCGTFLSRETRRCPGCGFRARPASPAPVGEEERAGRK